MKKTILEFETKWGLDDLGAHLLERASQLVTYLTERVLAPIRNVVELIEHEAKLRNEKVQSFLNSLDLATATLSLDFGPHDKEYRGHQWQVGADIPRESHESGDRHETVGHLRVVTQATYTPTVSEAVKNEEVLKIQRVSDERILRLIQEKEKLVRDIPYSDEGKDLIQVLKAVELFKKHRSSYPHRGQFLCSDRLIELLNEEAKKRGEQLEVRLIKSSR